MIWCVARFLCDIWASSLRSSFSVFSLWMPYRTCISKKRTKYGIVDTIVLMESSQCNRHRWLHPIAIIVVATAAIESLFSQCNRLQKQLRRKFGKRPVIGALQQPFTQLLLQRRLQWCSHYVTVGLLTVSINPSINQSINQSCCRNRITVESNAYRNFDHFRRSRMRGIVVS